MCRSNNKQGHKSIRFVSAVVYGRSISGHQPRSADHIPPTSEAQSDIPIIKRPTNVRAQSSLSPLFYLFAVEPNLAVQAQPGLTMCSITVCSLPHCSNRSDALFDASSPANATLRSVKCGQVKSSTYCLVIVFDRTMTYMSNVPQIKNQKT